MVKAKDCLWGKDFFDTYLYHARKSSYYNDILHKMGALALIGQSLRNVWIRADQTRTDCRIHPFVIQSSGTGKNSAFSMMGTVANASSIPFDEHGTASTAGIMGTVERGGDVKKGDLAGHGFVAWKEAQTLLKSADSTHSSDILEVLNMALDPEGRVEKSLSGGKLEYSSRTSMFCTTYPPEPNGQIELIKQGFLPRTLFIYRRMGEDFYDKVNKRRAEGIPRPGENNTSYKRQFEEDIQKLGNTLQYIEDTVYEHGEIMRSGDSHYARADEQIEYFEGVEDGVSIDPTDALDEVLDDYSHDIRKQARPFKTRFFDTTYRIAAALAAVDKNRENNYYVSRVIKERHVKNAKKIIKKSWRSVLEFIDDYQTVQGNNDLRRVYNSVEDVALANEGKAQIKDVMNETWLSKKQVKDYLRTLEEMDRVKSNGVAIAAADSDDHVLLPEHRLEELRL